MLVAGDFGVHQICKPCEEHLQRNLYEPLLEFNRLGPAAVSAIGDGRVAAILRLRREASGVDSMPLSRPEAQPT